MDKINKLQCEENQELNFENDLNSNSSKAKIDILQSDNFSNNYSSQSSGIFDNDEDEEESPKKLIQDIYKYISQPNPLLKEKQYQRQNQLPDYYGRQNNKQQDQSILSIENRNFQEELKKQNQVDETLKQYNIGSQSKINPENDNEQQNQNLQPQKKQINKKKKLKKVTSVTPSFARETQSSKFRIQIISSNKQYPKSNSQNISNNKEQLKENEQIQFQIAQQEYNKQEKHIDEQNFYKLTNIQKKQRNEGDDGEEEVYNFTSRHRLENKVDQKILEAIQPIKLQTENNDSSNNGISPQPTRQLKQGENTVSNSTLSYQNNLTNQERQRQLSEATNFTQYLKKQQQYDGPKTLLQHTKSLKLVYQRIDMQKNLGSNGSATTANQNNYSKSSLYASQFCDISQLKCNKFATFRENIILNTEPSQDLCLQQERQIGITIQKGDLQFESRFESGNLFSAHEVVEQKEYDLVLQNDINTKGNNQWFFFSVSNTVANQSVKFNILNQNKADSLFKKGMKISIFSSNKNQESRNCGWKKAGNDIFYQKNLIGKDGSYQKFYSTLSFNYTFEYNDDTVYFAYGYPYTYSDLNAYLSNVTQKYINNLLGDVHFTRKVLCKTLANNNVDYLTITSKSLKNIENRRGVVFMARQHPGENTGSFMVEGVMDFLLLSNSEEAKQLRENFVFKIIPMVNVDGVIHGNNRCSLSGEDLNRRWKNPKEELHPEVYSTKKMLQNFNLSHPITLVVDFHGHSRKTEAFFYGNSYKQKQSEITKIFPFICSEIEPQKFSFSSSRFKNNQCFESTARVALWKMLNIPNVFTLEASFFGYSQGGQNEKLDFQPQDFKQLGETVCKGLYKMTLDQNLNQFFDEKKSNIKNIKQQQDCQQNTLNNQDESGLHFDTIFQKNKEIILQNLQSREQRNLNNNQVLLFNNYNNNNSNQINNQGEDDFSGSDSDPSEDELEENIRRKYVPEKKISKDLAEQKRKKNKKIIQQEEKGVKIIKQKKQIPSSNNQNNNTEVINRQLQKKNSALEDVQQQDIKEALEKSNLQDILKIQEQQKQIQNHQKITHNAASLNRSFSIKQKENNFTVQKASEVATILEKKDAQNKSQLQFYQQFNEQQQLVSSSDQHYQDQCFSVNIQKKNNTQLQSSIPIQKNQAILKQAATNSTINNKYEGFQHQQQVLYKNNMLINLQRLQQQPSNQGTNIQLQQNQFHQRPRAKTQKITGINYKVSSQQQQRPIGSQNNQEPSTHDQIMSNYPGIPKISNILKETTEKYQNIQKQQFTENNFLKKQAIQQLTNDINYCNQTFKQPSSSQNNNNNQIIANYNNSNFKIDQTCNNAFLQQYQLKNQIETDISSASLDKKRFSLNILRKSHNISRTQYIIDSHQKINQGQPQQNSQISQQQQQYLQQLGHADNRFTIRQKERPNLYSISVQNSHSKQIRGREASEGRSNYIIQQDKENHVK